MVEHPLKVYNSNAGIYYLVRYWSHNEQHRILLTRSESLIDSYLSRFFKEDNDTKIVDVFQVELLAPSDLMCQKAIEFVHQEQLKDFLNEVTYSLHNNQIIKKEFLPSCFILCDKYLPKYWEEEPDCDYDFYHLDWHPDCINCSHGLKLQIPIEDFYSNYHQKWIEICSDKKSTDDIKLFYSRAKQATTENLWAAISDFGHHRKGIDLIEIDQFVDKPIINVLFYFQILQKINFDHWNNKLLEMKKNKKELEKIEFQNSKLNQKQLKLNRMQKLLSIFRD